MNVLKKLLLAKLVFLMSLPCPSLWANDKSYKTLLLGIYSEDNKQKNLEKIEQVFLEEIALKHHFELISQQSLNRALDKLSGSLEKETQIDSYQSFLDNAESHFLSSEFREAIASLESGIQKFYKSEGEAYFDLVSAHILLGKSYLALGDTKKANKVFQKLFYLDPQHQMDKEIYSPNTLKFLKTAHEKYLEKEKQSTRVVFNIKPSQAYIKVNGVSKGSLSDLELPAGEHFLQIEAPGYRSQMSRIKIGTTPFRFKTQLEKLDQTGNYLKTAIFLGKGESENKALARALLIARETQAEKVLLYHLSKTAWKDSLELKLLDVKKNLLQYQQRVEMSDVKSDLRSAANILLASVNDQVSKKVKGTDGTLIVMSKKKKSIASSPLLWTVLGVLLVGGGVGIAMGAGGGNSSSANLSSGSNTTTVGISGSLPRSP